MIARDNKKPPRGEAAGSFNNVTSLILRDLLTEGGHLGGAVQRLALGSKKADEGGAFDLDEVSDEREKSADEPGQARLNRTIKRPPREGDGH